MNRIKDNLAEVLQRIQEASAGRDNVKLIAVSKTKPVEMILDAFQAGQVLFGENRVQEARDKHTQLPSEINWHLIGPLQKNKAKYCPEIFSTIHTIHRFDVAEILNEKCRSLDKKMDILIQMNLTDEDSKSGVTSVDELHALADRIMSLDNLRLTGLMTMGDFYASDDENRKLFARLFEINQQEAARLGLKNQMVEISTGMSGDFEQALMEGATYVRIGSAIFGSR